MIVNPTSLGFSLLMINLNMLTYPSHIIYRHSDCFMAYYKFNNQILKKITVRYIDIENNCWFLKQNETSLNEADCVLHC